VIGGSVSVIFSQEKDLWNHVKLNPTWPYFMTFALFAAGSFGAALIWDHPLLDIFESFYRYGYLVFGGGQVVVPVMHTELVQVKELMTNQEFLTGYGLVQGLPGPMFSFSAYAGGMAARGVNVLYQILGSVLGGIGIFLPGLLLIYFIYPIWENMKKIKGIKVSLKGINAVAGGLIAISAVILMQKSGFTVDNLLVTTITAALLLTGKIPAPLLVLAALILGIIL
jgi:chromate transporter